MNREQVAAAVCDEVRQIVRSRSAAASVASAEDAMEVSEGSSFDLDLHFDSFAMVLLVTRLDERFGVITEPRRLSGLSRVGDLVSVYMRG